MLPGNLVTFRVLEPYAVKVASTVLRRERRGDPPDLSDVLFGQFRLQIDFRGQDNFSFLLNWFEILTAAC